MTSPALEQAARRGVLKWAPEGTFLSSGGIDGSPGPDSEASEVEVQAQGEAVVEALVEAIQSTRFGPAFCSGLKGAPQAVEAFGAQLAAALDSDFAVKLDAFKSAVADDPILRQRLGPFLVACHRLAAGDAGTVAGLLDELCLQLAG
jgi:hypothetical protein